MRLLATFAVLIVCTIHNIACDDDETLVEVEQGQMRGEKLKTLVNNYDYYSFKGIPYAKPPIGSLRFKDPEEPEKWDGVLDATKHGSVCPQYNPITETYTPGSEDCLFLNVYSRDLNPETPSLVLFYIHGGAYIFGSGDTDSYGPDYYLELGVIVVTINYRLGAFGFLSIGSEEVPGNAALKDQVLALKWVQKNIAKFGGDPNRVTIFGTTAGGHSVTLHMQSPMSKGLFQRAIAMSGSMYCDFAVTYKPERRAQIFGLLNNCTEYENPTELLTCLQAAQANEFYKIHPQVLTTEPITNVLFKMQDFAPVIEKKTGNNFLTEDYNTMLANGNVNKEVDFMIGHGNGEAVLLIDLYYAVYVELYNRWPELFAPSEHLTKCTPDTNLEVARRVKEFYFGDKPVTVDNIDLFEKYASSASIGYHAQRFANKWAGLGSNTYFFKANYFTNWNIYGQLGSKYGINKTAHFDLDSYSFLPHALNRTVNKDSLEYQLSQQLVTAIVNFAKYGNPNTDDLKWPAYTPCNKTYVTFTNDGPVIGNGPDEEENTFWEGIFDYAKIPF